MTIYDLLTSYYVQKTMLGVCTYEFKDRYFCCYLTGEKTKAQRGQKHCLNVADPVNKKAVYAQMSLTQVTLVAPVN